MEDSLPAEQTNRRGCTPCQAPWPTGASLMPVGKGHFLGHQAGCTGRAVPCFVSHLVRLAGDFFVLKQQLLTLLSLPMDV